MARVRVTLESTAFAHVVTGEDRFLEIARLAIGRLHEYERWDYFLEGGETTFGLQRAPEATIAMLCALDWLGARLEPGLRAAGSGSQFAARRANCEPALGLI